MNKYTNYCTPEQTLRAQKLGAPIESGIASGGFGIEERPFVYREPNTEYIKEHGFWPNSACWFIPTTQQMMGWLRDKGIRFEFNEYSQLVQWKITNNLIEYCKQGKASYGQGKTFQEAELAAIDAALDYLEKGETK